MAGDIEGGDISSIIEELESCRESSGESASPLNARGHFRTKVEAEMDFNPHRDEIGNIFEAETKNKIIIDILQAVNFHLSRELDNPYMLDLLQQLGATLLQSLSSYPLVDKALVHGMNLTPEEWSQSYDLGYFAVCSAAGAERERVEIARLLAEILQQQMQMRESMRLGYISTEDGILEGEPDLDVLEALIRSCLRPEGWEIHDYAQEGQNPFALGTIIPGETAALLSGKGMLVSGSFWGSDSNYRVIGEPVIIAKGEVRTMLYPVQLQLV